jgi:hypothetical protein
MINEINAGSTLAIYLPLMAVNGILYGYITRCFTKKKCKNFIQFFVNVKEKIFK